MPLVGLHPETEEFLRIRIPTIEMLNRISVCLSGKFCASGERAIAELVVHALKERKLTTALILIEQRYPAYWRHQPRDCAGDPAYGVNADKLKRLYKYLEITTVPELQTQSARG